MSDFRRMRPRFPRAWSLFGSLALHATLGLSTGLTAPSSARAGAAAPVAAADLWVGEAFEVDALTERGEGPAPVPEPAPRAEPPPVPPPAAEEPQPARPEPAEDAARALGHAASAESTAALGSARPAVDPSADRAPSLEARPTAAGGDGIGSASFGAAGSDPSVRNLPKAFARALPAAASARDLAWLRLPAGAAGRAQVTLTLDDGGHVGEVEFEDEEEVPAHLKSLVRRAVRLLGTGRFALSAARSESGREAFSLVASVSDGPPLGDEFADPDHILLREFEAPAPERPGKAVFGYASGRRVEVRVELVPSPAQRR